MHHVAVGLDGHEVLDLHGSVLAHASEVVAPEVHQHHVLGPLLLVLEQLAGDARVLLDVRAARPRAGDRARGDLAARHGQKRLGTRPRDLEVAEVEEVHVRAGVDSAQTAVDRERVHRRGRRPALRGHDLEGVPGVHVLDDAGDHRLEGLTRHVALELGHGAIRVRRMARPRHRSGEPPAHVGDGVVGGGVGVVHVLLGVHVGQHADRVLEVVEDDQHVGEHQRQVGHADRVGVGLPERFDRAHEVIAEHAHRPSGEGRQVGQRRLVVARHGGRGDLVRVAGVPERPANHLAGPEADERVAAHALALIGRFQEERGPVLAQLEEGRHRRLAVVDERVAQRDQVVVAGQRPHLLQARRDRGRLSGDGH